MPIAFPIRRPDCLKVAPPELLGDRKPGYFRGDLIGEVICGIQAILSQQLLDGQAIGSRLGKDQSCRAYRLAARPMEDQAVNSVAIMIIALKSSRLLGRIFELPFQAVNLVSERESRIDQFPCIGRHQLKISVKTIYRGLVILEWRRRFFEGSIQ